MKELRNIVFYVVLMTWLSVCLLAAGFDAPEQVLLLLRQVHVSATGKSMTMTEAQEMAKYLPACILAACSVIFYVYAISRDKRVGVLSSEVQRLTQEIKLWEARFSRLADGAKIMSQFVGERNKEMQSLRVFEDEVMTSLNLVSAKIQTQGAAFAEIEEGRLQEWQNLRETVSQLTSQGMELNERIEGLKQGDAVVEKELNRLEKLIEKIEGAVDELNDDVFSDDEDDDEEDEDDDEEDEDEDDDDAEDDDEEYSFTERIENFKTRLKEAGASLTTLETFKAECASHGEAVAALESKLLALQDEKTGLKATAVALDNKLTDLKESADELGKIDREDIEDFVTRLEEEKDELETSLTTLQESLDSVQKLQKGISALALKMPGAGHTNGQPHLEGSAASGS